jgi:hypothetical protein
MRSLRMEASQRFQRGLSRVVTTDTPPSVQLLNAGLFSRCPWPGPVGMGCGFRNHKIGKREQDAGGSVAYIGQRRAVLGSTRRSLPSLIVTTWIRRTSSVVAEGLRFSHPGSFCILAGCVGHGCRASSSAMDGAIISGARPAGARPAGERC